MFKNIAILIILIFAVIIRSYNLSTLPPSLYYDELDAGYQAEVFNKNKTDYYGNKNPVHFQSFGDYRTSLYVYSVALAQKIIPDKEFSTRLPSVIFGVVSIYLIYLLTNSLIASLLFTISPWAIHYSRIAFEASGMIMVLLAGIYFWKKFTQNSRFSHLLLSIFFFALSPYFYSTSKLFLILLAVLLGIIWFPKLIKLKPKKIFIALLFGALILSPLLVDTFKGKSGFRFSYISIFSEPQLASTVDYLRYADIFTTHQNQTGVSPSLSSKLFHNKYVLILDKFLENYFSAFSTEFLFTKGDQNQRHGFGNHGLLYYLDFFLIIFGIINVIKNRHQDKLGNLFLWILILAPIPFALTRDSTGAHATRLILMLPSLIYLSYQGILYIKYLHKFTLPVIVFLYFISFASFWHYYKFNYPQDSAMAWNWGMKEAVLLTHKYPDNPLVFSDSYISFVSFYLFYKPYQLEKGDSIKSHLISYSDDSFSGQRLDDKYYFGSINWSNISKFPQNTIYVLPKSEIYQIPKSLRALETIEKKYINSEGFALFTNEQ